MFTSLYIFSFLKHTVTGALGLLFAAVFARTVSHLSHQVLMLLFGLLTTLHIIANMNCMKLISFDYLNTPRMNMIVKNILDQIDLNDDTETYQQIVSIDPPSVVSKQEPLFFIGKNVRPFTYVPIRFGVSFHSVYSNTKCFKNLKHVDLVVDSLETKKYSIIQDFEMRANFGRGCVFVMLSEKATGLDKTKAYFHALLFQSETLKRDLSIKKRRHSKKETFDDSLDDFKQKVETKMSVLWPLFVRKANDVGWDLARTDLRSEGFEIGIDLKN